MASEFINLRELGRGNSGVVFKSVHVPTMRVVALKRVRTQKRKREEIVQELQSLYSNLVPLDDFEAKAKCHQIVSFHGAFTNAEQMSVSLVLEYMDAGTLQDLVERKVHLSESTIARLATTILKGLAFIHERRQIHRDIKPGNILVNARGEAKISDFGISRNFDALNLSCAKTFTGTTIYMSPERLEGKEYTYAADIWSFGLTIFTLANRAFPFGSTTSKMIGFWELTRCVREDKIPTLSPEHFSKGLIDLCERCMRKKPNERSSAKELLRHPFLIGKRKKKKRDGEVALLSPKLLRKSRRRRGDDHDDGDVKELRAFARKLERRCRKLTIRKREKRKQRRLRRMRRAMSAPGRSRRRLEGIGRLPSLAETTRMDVDSDEDDEDEALDDATLPTVASVERMATQLNISPRIVLDVFASYGLIRSSERDYVDGVLSRSEREKMAKKKRRRRHRDRTHLPAIV